MSDNTLTLRSYRLAFEVERRLHRIDRFRIPVPYGIPLVALGYWAVVMVAFLLAGTLPVTGSVLAALPWPVRLILLPGLVTRALCHQRADGRPAHEAIAAYVAFLAAPKHLVGLAPVAWDDPVLLGQVAVAPDEHAELCPRGVVRGPCVVVLRRPARLEVRGRGATLTPLEGGDALVRPQEVELPAGARMEVVPCERR
jgi:hypothetical protein